MKRIKNYLLTSQLVKGSLIIFAGSTLVNFGNYLYHLLMGRMLGPESYGVLTALISLLYLLLIPSLTINTMVVKFTTTYKAQKKLIQIYGLLRTLSEKFLIIGVVVFFVFILFRNALANFLQISQTLPLILASTLFMFSLLTTVNNGILQGFLKFAFFSVNNVFSVLLKLALGYFLVRAGLSVNGAILAMILSYIFPYLASFYPLRFLWQQKPSASLGIEWAKVWRYTSPVFLATLGMTSLYSADIILVKHFFPSFEAGLYAALGMLGKIVFFASGTIVAVMFPLVSERFENGREFRHLLWESAILVTLSSAFITLIYFLWPSLMVEFLYGSAYLGISSYLGFFALFISLYSLVNLFLQFFLSIGKTRVAYLPLVAAFTQIVLIWFFHSSIWIIIGVSFGVTALLLVTFLVYYLYYAQAKI